jgi:hypothetical protein
LIFGKIAVDEKLRDKGPMGDCADGTNLRTLAAEACKGAPLLGCRTTERRANLGGNRDAATQEK